MNNLVGRSIFHTTLGDFKVEYFLAEDDTLEEHITFYHLEQKSSHTFKDLVSEQEQFKKHLEEKKVSILRSLPVFEVVTRSFDEWAVQFRSHSYEQAKQKFIEYITSSKNLLVGLKRTKDAHCVEIGSFSTNCCYTS